MQLMARPSLSVSTLHLLCSWCLRFRLVLQLFRLGAGVPRLVVLCSLTNCPIVASGNCLSLCYKKEASSVFIPGLASEEMVSGWVGPKVVREDKA